MEDVDRQKIVLDGCMVTYTGIIFDLMHPNPDLIDLRDIAHGLAFNCRWNGATKRLYTIAEHCIRVSDRIDKPRAKRLTALFHDAEEAYWGDMIKPLKEIVKIKSPEIIEMMDALRKMIFEKFHIEDFDVHQEDWDELVWDFETMILTNNHKPLTSRQAEKQWLFLAKIYNPRVI
jgi:5'-deoxynucleotidase YfbR-like HD superfamily hydrolase